MADWQDISTAVCGARIDALCVDEYGINVEFPNVVLVDDDAPYAFAMWSPTGTKTYWPHENGYALERWRPYTPPRSGL